MDNEQQVKGINYTNDGSVSLGEIRELLEDEEAELYEDIEKSQRKENEKFIQNMKNVLEIEKKSAVKEFARKCKDLINADYVNGCLNNHKGYLTGYDIDELLKEYLK